MKVAVTGANGFIGQHLVKRLQQDGHKILPIPHELLYKKHDLQRLLKKEKPNKMYHLAAYGNHSWHTQNAYVVEANLIPLLNILDSMQFLDMELVNVSSSSVSLPVQTLYSISKRAGEEICELQRKKGYVIRNVRPYSVYGPGEDDNRFIPTVIRKLMFGETVELFTSAYHDWIYIDDFIEALVENYLPKAKMHIGTGESWSNLQVFHKLMSIIVQSNVEIDFKVIEGRSYDNTEWRSPTSVKHRSLSQGLIETYHYYHAKYTAAADLEHQ